MQLKRKYKHKRTGAIVFSPGLIIGDNWIEIKDDEVEETKEEYVSLSSTLAETKEEFVSLSSILA